MVNIYCHINYVKFLTSKTVLNQTLEKRYIIEKYHIQVIETRIDNHERTIQRYRQHWSQDTERRQMIQKQTLS